MKKIINKNNKFRMSKCTQKSITTTCREMFEQRGYTDIVMKDGNKIMAIKPDQKKICVFLEVISKFNVPKYQEYMTLINKMKLDHCILICNTITPTIEKTIKNSPNIRVKIETFYEKNLRYNITKHELVPKHIKLSTEESQSFKNKYCPNGTEFKSIPLLNRSDPVARFYGFQRGDIIKILRKGTHGTIVAYRIVK